MAGTIANGHSQPLVLWFEEVGLKDIAIVGGKNASLGEMIRTLTHKGISVPGGFATTSYAYQYFVQQAGIETRLREILGSLDVSDVNALARAGNLARQIILETPFPKDLGDSIIRSYREMCNRFGGPHRGGAELDCAVRSSATAEDLPDASFAGQQDTYLNIRGEHAIVEAVHRCFASLFTDRAISYRQVKNFDHFLVQLSVGIQLMVRSDLAASGVMFSIDTETGFKDTVVINASYGLGENIVQGSVNPDEYVVFKPTLLQGYKPIVERKLGSKEQKMVYDQSKGNKGTSNIPVPIQDRNRFAITDEQILILARWACIIEEHYSGLHGHWTPMDMEWAVDGLSGQLFIVQARPETVQSQKAHKHGGDVLVTYHLELPKGGPHPILTSGVAVGSGIGKGRARVISDPSQMASFKDGEVLVTQRTDPDWEPIMKKAGAIVTSVGGRTCHAAIIARELGIPAVVGCGNATEAIQTGVEISIVCSQGETGFIYGGLVPFRREEVRIDNIPQTRTQLLMNIGNPSEAFALSKIPAQGVGLARLEFIIANHVKIHPLALMNFPNLRDPAAIGEIAKMTPLYADNAKAQFFVDRLASGIATIAAAMHPRPVIVRMSDFKSNEYANLLGGREFEPLEENPMIGWRGASRYYDPKFRAAFALECQAFVKVRMEMGLKNVIVMIPFCRTPDEGRKVLAEMAANGLRRGQDGLQVYVMCEVPSNVILADEFAKVFDGFSIGSNDLTQLTLGLDRDSGLIAHLFDERNNAVKEMVRMVIATARRNGVKIGICGQAPSDFPDFARFLVEQGINSISLNPDSLIKTTLDIAALEERLGIAPTQSQASVNSAVILYTGATVSAATSDKSSEKAML
ncbi:phosphoenolpyruvate synthase [Cladochytrium replicatum]|nr:phosphoenolpyruvate synthase [Cladochytrium replicatum]